MISKPIIDKLINILLDFYVEYLRKRMALRWIYRTARPIRNNDMSTYCGNNSMSQR